MLAVVVFEPCKVSFETVGGRRDRGVVEVMKHMGQCFEQHTAGVLEIAEYPATFRDLRQLGAIASLPGANGEEEGISLRRGVDRCDAEKYFPQTFGIRAGGVPPTPHQALALDMDQAALNDDGWPHSPNHPDGLWVAVERTTDRRQPIGLKRLEERRELPLRVFVDPILTMDDLAPRAVHDGDEPTTLIQEGPIEDQVARRIRFGQGRRPVEPMVYDTVQCRRAELTEIPELAYAESFGQPPFEPHAAVGKMFVDPFPVKRPATVETPPSLPAIAVMTVAFDPCASTVWAMFFSVSYRHYRTSLIMGSISH